MINMIKIANNGRSKKYPLAFDGFMNERNDISSKIARTINSSPVILTQTINENDIISIKCKSEGKWMYWMQNHKGTPIFYDIPTERKLDKTYLLVRLTKTGEEKLPRSRTVIDLRSNPSEKEGDDSVHSNSWARENTIIPSTDTIPSKFQSIDEIVDTLSEKVDSLSEKVDTLSEKVDTCLKEIRSLLPAVRNSEDTISKMSMDLYIANNRQHRNEALEEDTDRWLKRVNSELDFSELFKPDGFLIDFH